jgi:hypothetical protein
LTPVTDLVDSLRAAAERVRRSSVVSLVLYGSALEASVGVLPRDVDLWVEGDDPEAVELALARLRPDKPCLINSK